jgi:hypothetical protein
VRIRGLALDAVTSGTAECAFRRDLVDLAIEDKRCIVPRVVMKCAIIIAAAKLVEVDIGPRVARDDIPAAKIVIADHIVRLALGHDPGGPCLHVGKGGAGGSCS